jgi:hypothetical protein
MRIARKSREKTEAFFVLTEQTSRPAGSTQTLSKTRPRGVGSPGVTQENILKPLVDRHSEDESSFREFYTPVM